MSVSVLRLNNCHYMVRSFEHNNNHRPIFSSLGMVGETTRLLKQVAPNTLYITNGFQLLDCDKREPLLVFIVLFLSNIRFLIQLLDAMRSGARLGSHAKDSIVGPVLMDLQISLTVIERFIVLDGITVLRLFY
jgi:hypothetical protein